MSHPSIEPYISVVIPAADGRLSNLHLVLTSLETQTFPRERFEVIVVSDGGQDSFSDVLARHKELSPIFVWQPRHDPMEGQIERDIVPKMPAITAPPDEVSAWQQENRAMWQGIVDKMFALRSVKTMQPRNRGARNARYPFYVFADSDVLLHPRALEYYAQDFAENPNRVVIGSYHWLHPMRVSTSDVRSRFEDILNERLTLLPRPAMQTHNICRDMRGELFREELDWTAQHGALRVWQTNSPQEMQSMYPKFLACYSGNIGYPADIFWGIGGYDDRLYPGIHEDGASGLALMTKGYGISFDGRIRAGHLYHERSLVRVRAPWYTEIPYLNQRFHLEQYADGAGVHDDVSPLEAMSNRALEEWGVAHWKQDMTTQAGKTGWDKNAPSN